LIILTAFSPSFSATHVFWYKALQNGYHLSDNPGPNLNILQENVHEGLIVCHSCKYTTSTTYPTFWLSSADLPSWRSFIYFEDLNNIKGTITSAKLRMEYFDCRDWMVPGNIKFYVGVEDVWKRTYGFPIMDSLLVCKPASYGLPYGAYIMPWQEYQTDTIGFVVPQGKADSSQYPPPLAKTFFEINVTNQVRYIVESRI